MKRGWIVGLDIGGTFTDAVMVHSATRQSARFKCLTTPEDPSRGALLGIEGVLAEARHALRAHDPHLAQEIHDDG